MTESRNERIFDPMAAINHADLAPTTRRQYRKAIRRYLMTGAALTDAQALTEYSAGLPRSSRAFLKAAIRLITAERVNDMKARATSANVGSIQAALYRFEALNDAVKVRPARGEKAHTWLTPAEVQEFLSAVDAGIAGERDRVVLALLVGAGLRRDELVSLTFSDIKMQGTRTVLEIVGKGAKGRVVPISNALAALLAHWGERFGHRGRVVRSLGTNRQPGESITGAAVFDIVRKHGARIGKPHLAPHDCRRTYAQIGVDAGIPIQQLSILLGHASIATTQAYLNLALDLETTVSDFIPLPAT